MSVKEQMLKARELIKRKRYDEARAILKKINHPKAKEWLAKIDKIAPEKKSGGGRTVLVRLLLLLIVIAIAVVAFVLLSGSDEPDSIDMTITAVNEINATRMVQQSMTQTAAAGGSDDTSDTDSDTSDNSESDDAADDEMEEATPTPEDDDSDDTDSSSAASDGDRLVFENIIGIGGTLTVAVPDGWTKGEGLSTVIKGDFQTSATAISTIPGMGGMELRAVVDAMRAEGETAEITEYESNGREVVEARIESPTADGSGQQVVYNYFVQDDDGDTVVFVIQPFVPDPTSLRDDVLFMAGNVEVE